MAVDGQKGGRGLLARSPWQCVLFFSYFVWLSVYAYDSKFVARVPVRRDSFAEQPHNCARVDCVPHVLGGLAGWRRHNKPKSITGSIPGPRYSPHQHTTLTSAFACVPAKSRDDDATSPL